MSYVSVSSEPYRAWPRVRQQTNDPWFLLPGGARVRGSNIVPQAAHQDWHWLWRDWAWTDWIKWQIDLLAGLTGANTVRVMGTYKAIYDATLTEADYLDRWDQLATYVADLGMYLYPCTGGDFAGAYGYTPTSSFVAEQAAQVAERLRDYPNIIGIDLVQERQSWAKTEGEMVRSAVLQEIDVPLTFSIASTSQADFANTTWRSEIANVVDFFDYHINGHTPDSTEFTDDYWTAQPRPLLIGEFGAPLSLGSVAQAARYSAVSTNAGSTATRSDGTAVKCAGCLSWAITDQDTINTNQWGMFDATGAERTYLTDVFEALPA